MSSLPGKGTSSLDRVSWKRLLRREKELAFNSRYILTKAPCDEKKIFVGVMNDSKTKLPVYYALAYQACYEEADSVSYSPRLFLRTEAGDFGGTKIIIDETFLFQKFNRSELLSGDLQQIQQISSNLNFIKVIRSSASRRSLIGQPSWI